MRVYFPDFFTEAHRTPERGEELVAAFARHGVECRRERAGCDIAFCGSVWKSEEFEQRDGLLVHYNWDLYPWQVDGKSPDCWKPELWKPYIGQLNGCAAVVVPSQCTVARTLQFAKHADVHVVRAPVKLWDAEVCDGGYVLDVMRKYPDPNRHAVRDACEALGIPCVETGANLPWEEFKAKVAGARLLVSAYYEASTGGLTLLEGYALGKRVLLSNSPYNGAVDYFGPRGEYFQWSSPASLRDKIRDMYYGAAAGHGDAKQWVEENFNDDIFAAGVTEVLKKCLTTKST